MAKQPKKNGKPIIGLAGGIGSGKSTVAAELAKLGCKVIDADKIGHALLAGRTVKHRLVGKFGRSILNSKGMIDRHRLAEIVFNRPRSLEALNAIMHPLIGKNVKSEILRVTRNPRCRAIVLDAALLFEAGWDKFCSHVVFIQASRQARLARVSSQRSWDRLELKRRENSQFPLDTKRRNCCYRLSNSSDLSSLRRRVRRLFDIIIHAKNTPF